MAEEAVKTSEKEKQKEAAPVDAAAAPPRSRRKFFMTIGLFGGVMLLEGLGIVVVMKHFGAEPDPTEGMELHATTSAAAEHSEIELASLNVPNISETRTMYYRMRLVIVVDMKDEARVKEALVRKKWTIEDSIVRLVREARERDLSEPDLATIRRKIRHEIGTILGEKEVIQQVLIPECLPVSTGF